MTNYLNEVYETKRSGTLKVTNYKSWNDVTVEFIKTGYTKVCSMNDIKKGGIKDPFYPLVFSVGFLGVGDFSRKTHQKIYDAWFAMLRRCYSHDQLPSYVGVTVCGEWHNFQQFAQWAVIQKGCDNSGWHLDKDILSKGNCIYSPDTCAFVPARLNMLFIKMFSPSDRGDQPIGVCYLDKEDKYLAQVMNKDNKREKKYFKSKDAAFAWYKSKKESLIEYFAEEYKSIIDTKVYSALISYKVEVAD